jgi:hypothetical protein
MFTDNIIKIKPWTIVWNVKELKNFSNLDIASPNTKVKGLNLVKIKPPSQYKGGQVR